PADARLASGQEAEALDPALTPDQAHPLRLEALRRGGVVLVLSEDVATRHRRGVGLPVAVERERTSDGAGHQRGPADTVPQLGGRKHGFAGNAGEVGALAAHEALLHESHALATGCQPRCGVLARRASGETPDY